MTLEKWDNVLIQWVNCLKLVNPITEIENLKYCSFVNNFLKLLISDNYSARTDVLQTLTLFLKNQYPNINFLHKSETLQDLEHKDFVIVCSLLLHYSSICDGRRRFIFPLCYQLSKETQICIRTFLENVSIKSTVNEVFNAITCAVTKFIKTKDIYTNTSLNRTIGNSPLQEILNISSNQLVSLETFTELLNVEEVSGYNDKNDANIKWDETEMKEKVTEWKRDFNYSLYSSDTNILQKMLKNHIIELEKCFNKFYMERVQLQKEYDILQDKIQNLEAYNYNVSVFGTNGGSNEINQLYTTLTEVTALIEAIQESKADPMSVLHVDDSRPNIQELINHNLQNAHDLKENIQIFYTNYHKLENTYTSIKTGTDDFAFKISSFYHNQKELNRIRMEAEAAAEQLCHFIKQGNYSTNINEFEEQFKISKSRIDDLLCKFDDLINHDREIVQEVNQESMHSFTDTIQTVETLYDSTLSSYNEQNIYLSSIKINFNNLESNIDNRMNSLEELFSDVNDFTHLNWSNKETKKEVSCKDIIFIFDEMVEELKLNVRICTNKTSMALDEYINLSKHLKRATSYVSVLEQLIFKHTRNMNVLEFNINEVDATINQLQMFKTNEKESTLNIRLFKYLNKIEHNKAQLKNIERSIYTLKENKTSIEDQTVILKSKLKEGDNFDHQILELQSLESVFDEEIRKRTEKSILCQESINNLQVNIDMLRQQVSPKTYNNQEDATSKSFKEDIEAIYAEIEYYLTHIYKLELNIHILTNNLAEAEKDMIMLLKSQENLQNYINYSKNSHEKYLLILDHVLRHINEKLLIIKNKEKQVNIESKCLTYNHLMSKEEIHVDNKINCLLSTTCKEKNSYLISSVNQAVKTTDDTLACETVSSESQNPINQTPKNYTRLSVEYYFLKKIREDLEEKYRAEMEEKLIKLSNELAVKGNQLQTITQQYKQQLKDVEVKICFSQNALFEIFSELKKFLSNFNIIGNYNMDKISEMREELYELHKKVISNNRKSKACVEDLRTTTRLMHFQIVAYIESLKDGYKTYYEHGVQVKMLKKNLYKVIERRNSLDKEYEDAINKLEMIQSQLDRYQCQKLEFETQLLRQNFFFEEEYKKTLGKLNLKIKEIMRNEFDLKTKLAKSIKGLEECNWGNNNLYDQFNEMRTEFSRLKDNKAYVEKKLINFNFFCRGLKEDFDSLSNSRINLIRESYEKMVDLQTDLSRHIEMLMSENSNLKDSISSLQKYFFNIQAKHNCIVEERLEYTTTIVNEEISLENKRKTVENSIHFLLEEEALLEKSILEKKQDDFVFIALLSAKDIFKIGRTILEQDLRDCSKKIDGVKQSKTQAEVKYHDELLIMEKNMREILIKIKLLQIELGENSSKNNKLLLELCTVNVTLSSFTKQYATLTEARNREKSNETTSVEVNNNFILQNIKAKNKTLSSKIACGKNEIEELKEKITNVFLERQGLDLEAQIINENIDYHEHHLQEYEKSILSVNAEALEKLDKVVKLQKYTCSLEDKIKLLYTALANVKEEREYAVKNRKKAFDDTEKVIRKTHRHTVEMLIKFLKLLTFSEKHVSESNLKNEIENLIEGENVAKEILNINLLEQCSEKCILLHLFSCLNHYIICEICMLQKLPICLTLNNDVVLLNVNNTREVNKIFERIQQEIVSCLPMNISFTENKAKSVANVNYLDETYSFLSFIKKEHRQTLLRCQSLQNVHFSLTEKYNLLIKSLEHNEHIELFIFEEVIDIVGNILDTEKETITLYRNYTKSYGYPITYSNALSKLLYERNYVENIFAMIKNNKLRKSETAIFFADFLCIYQRYMNISRKLYNTVLIIMETHFGLKSRLLRDDLLEEITTDNTFKEMKDCCAAAKALLQQLLSFQENYNLMQIRPRQSLLELDVESAENNTSSEEDEKICENIQHNFYNKIEKHLQRYSLFKKQLRGYYTLYYVNSEKIDSPDSNDKLDVKVQTVIRKRKRINTDINSEEALQSKKIKLEICADGGKIQKNDSSPIKITHNSVVLPKLHRAAKTSITFLNQETNFGQQFSKTYTFCKIGQADELSCPKCNKDNFYSNNAGSTLRRERLDHLEVKTIHKIFMFCLLTIILIFVNLHVI